PFWIESVKWLIRRVFCEAPLDAVQEGRHDNSQPHVTGETQATNERQTALQLNDVQKLEILVNGQNIFSTSVSSRVA
ncbi:MAG: hypothetical protein K9L30_06975, partial [Desulfobacterales bacterium]|nr:hypothetical protein [Desulfobacterales bacterium]